MGRADEPTHAAPSLKSSRGASCLGRASVGQKTRRGIWAGAVSRASTSSSSRNFAVATQLNSFTLSDANSPLLMPCLRWAFHLASGP